MKLDNIEKSEYILCTGLFDDHNEDLNFYKDLFRKKYKKYLNADDYIKRADYLAWNGDRWDLQRLIRYLPKDYELLYNARHLLMSKGYGVDQAIANVPQKFKNDAGLNYDRLKWRRKKDVWILQQKSY